MRFLSRTLHPVSSCLEHHVAVVTSVCRNWKSKRFVQKKEHLQKMPVGHREVQDKGMALHYHLR